MLLRAGSRSGRLFALFVIGLTATGCRWMSEQSSALTEASCPSSRVVTKAETERMKKEEIEQLDAFSAFALESPDDKSNTPENLALVVKMALARLYYPVSLERLGTPHDDPQLCSAWRKFESSAGINVDGVVTIAELGRLVGAADKATETNIVLPMRSVIAYPDYVSVQGTWVMQGETIAWPINHSNITCSKSDRTCVEFSVNLSGGADDGSPALLNSNVEHYDLRVWTAEQVEAVSEALCAETRLTINTKSKTAFSVTAPLDKPSCREFQSKAGLPTQKRPPRLSVLEDGFEVSRRFYEQRRETAKKMFAPSVQEALSRHLPAK